MPTLEFKGKQFIYSHHLSVPFRELKVDAAKSFPTPGQKPSLDYNLIIHGDNLEALKALLPTHAGKSTQKDAIILDSFAGSGTTAHAVLEANRKDGGNRRFILVECEDYADTLTAERVSRVINGYAYKGTQRTELHREKITWSAFEKKHGKILDRVESIEQLEGAGYDKVKKEIVDGVLTVTGERQIEERVPGLGGSFTFCTLGEPIDIESLLTGKGLPDYGTLAHYVFYTATGRSLETLAEPSADGFIGETELFRIHLFYQPDTNWLRSNEAALNAERVGAVAKGNKTGKRAIVFAVAKFMSQKELTARRKLFELLTVYVETAIRTGVLDLTEEKPPISFTMLTEDTWKQELAEVGIL